MTGFAPSSPATTTSPCYRTPGHLYWVKSRRSSAHSKPSTGNTKSTPLLPMDTASSATTTNTGGLRLLRMCWLASWLGFDSRPAHEHPKPGCVRSPALERSRSRWTQQLVRCLHTIMVRSDEATKSGPSWGSIIDLVLFGSVNPPPPPLNPLYSPAQSIPEE